MINKIIYIIVFCSFPVFIYHCSDESSNGSSDNPIYGCTDSSSSNYDSTATQDDGSCIYCDIDTTYKRVISGTAGYDIIRSNNCSFVLSGTNGKTILMKINEVGEEIWSQTYNEINGNHWGTTLNPTADGGYIIGGLTNVIKTDSMGVLEWYYKLPYSNAHYIENITQTFDGDYVVVGGVNGDPGTGGHNQRGQAFILRLSEGGGVQWVKRYGISNTPMDTFYGVVQADDGGFVTAGSKLHDRNFEFYNHFWVVKMNESGNIDWSHELGGNYWDEAQDIVKLSDDSYVVAGKKSLSKTNINLWIMRISASGSILWQSNHGGGNNDTGTALTITDNEAVAVATGYSRGSSGSSFSYRVWGIDADSGQLLWNKIHGGNQEDKAYGVAEGYDNGFMVIGRSYSFGSERVNWLVKTDSLGRVGN